jgi:predicted Zn-dependent protease
MRAILVICFVFLSSIPVLASDDNTKEVIATNHRKIGRGLNFYSLQREINLGAAMAQDMERTAPVVDDPVVSEYVNRIGQNLVRNSESKFLLTVKVLGSDEINAIALPGGFMFVNAGAILAAESESELASVIAHEIGHVSARHATRRATNRQIVDIGAAGVVFVGGLPGYIIRHSLDFGITFAFGRLNRRSEREADRLGLQYMSRTGYDPSAFKDLLERLERSESDRPGFLSQILSTHPSQRSRMQDVERQIQRGLPALREGLVQTSEFANVKARLKDIQKGVRVPNPPDELAIRKNLRLQAGATGDVREMNGPPTLRRSN